MFFFAKQIYVSQKLVSNNLRTPPNTTASSERGGNNKFSKLHASNWAEEDKKSAIAKNGAEKRASL